MMIALSRGLCKPFLTVPSCDCRVSIATGRRASLRPSHFRYAPKAVRCRNAVAVAKRIMHHSNRACLTPADILARPKQTGGACRPTSEPRQAPPWYRAPLAPTVFIMDSPGRLVRARRDRDRAGSGGKRPPDTEPEVAVPVAGGVPVAAGRAEDPWIEVPGTAAKDTATATISCPRQTIRGRSVVVVVPAVLDPVWSKNWNGGRTCRSWASQAHRGA